MQPLENEAEKKHTIYERIPHSNAFDGNKLRVHRVMIRYFAFMIAKLHCCLVYPVQVHPSPIHKILY